MGAATSVGVPQEHMLAASIGIALARALDEPSMKLSLVAPMRDGQGEDLAIANLVTVRHVSVHFRGRSLVSVVLELSRRLRARDWTLCDILVDDGDRCFLNIHGMPAFDCGVTPVVEVVDTTLDPTKLVRNIAEMVVAQEAEDAWTLPKPSLHA